MEISGNQSSGPSPRRSGFGHAGGPNKAVILGVVVLVIVLGAGAWWYFAQKTEIAVVEEPTPEPIKTSEDVVEAVTAPELEVGSNPVENKVPEVNPVDRANPFKDAYQNPFE